jgi:hypothetical protein
MQIDFYHAVSDVAARLVCVQPSQSAVEGLAARQLLKINITPFADPTVVINHETDAFANFHFLGGRLPEDETTFGRRPSRSE